MSRTTISRLLRGALPVVAVIVLFSLTLGAERRADGAWVRIGPPGAKVHSGYFEFQNPSVGHLDIVGASSPHYERVEIHRSKVVDGIASMEPLSSVRVHGGTSVSFKPGDRHLMLINPNRKVVPGQTVEINLRLSNGSVVSTQAVAKSLGKSHAHRGSQQ